MSEKWSKRWPSIEQPRPAEGTLNPDVINTIRVLVTAHKAEEKTGRKGQKREGKRQTELEMLQLFEREGKKLLTATKEKNQKSKEEIAKNREHTEELMTKINTPFSHTASAKSPLPSEKGAECTNIYPQRPVISQDGTYKIKDDDDQTIEKGKAKTTIQMYPTSKSKTKKRHGGTVLKLKNW